jgi:hypothetical protein
MVGGRKGWIGLGLALSLASWTAPGWVAEPAGVGYNWLRLEQRGERLRLQTDQARYRKQRDGVAAPGTATDTETERLLQRQRREQEQLFNRQLQEELRLEQRRRIGARETPDQAGQLQRQRVQQQNRQMRLHQDLQRRARPGTLRR